MGEAKWRKAEIEELKRKSPEEAAQWRVLQNDRRRISSGINPASSDPESTAAMARALASLLAEAKNTGNIDPPVKLLHKSVGATLLGLSDVPIACKNGCSHCCNIWVSVSIPEVLHIAKIVEQRGTSAIEKVRKAYQETKDYEFDVRDEHPYPCPLLDEDSCSIYDERPRACRLAASADAEICARTYHNITNEGVPTPAIYLTSRAAYGIAMAAGLRHAGLAYHGYELNAALLRALETDGSEKRWLSGEDVFADIRRDPEDVFAHPQAIRLYEYAFSRA